MNVQELLLDNSSTGTDRTSDNVDGDIETLTAAIQEFSLSVSATDKRESNRSKIESSSAIDAADMERFMTPIPVSLLVRQGGGTGGGGRAGGLSTKNRFATLPMKACPLPIGKSHTAIFFCPRDSALDYNTTLN